MKTIILWAAVVATFYNIAGCSSAKDALANHHYDVVAATANVAHGVDNLNQSDYVGAAGNALDAVAQRENFIQEENQLIGDKNRHIIWAWIFASVALIFYCSGGKLKS